MIFYTWLVQVSVALVGVREREIEVSIVTTVAKVTGVVMVHLGRYCY